MCLPIAIVFSSLSEVSAHAKLIDLDYFTLAMSDKKRYLTKIFFLRFAPRTSPLNLGFS